ncbi:hypothetical protein E2562_016263 [Oryza meyeriana var. granulata]|uniref:Uncharacterized protein n=1 Tax=Oryza meyeriana var. granulata TaxID=110450 RepID=A0A6G1CPM9_9ORYZ|nr:hypothetical protein E2562_016263 [Oryza meyeriana var. granulata]
MCGNQATRPAARCTRQAPPPDVCSNQETRPAARSTRQGLLQAWRNRRLLACACLVNNGAFVLKILHSN